MAWEYNQSTGILKYNDVVMATGYSGHGLSKNNPDNEGLANEGPIPKGTYTIQYPRNSSRTGKHVLPLVPHGHNALGRSDFQIHGDSVKNPGTASHGCIILPRNIREMISNSGDHVLKVSR